MEHNPKYEQVFETYWRGLDKDDALVSFKAQMELLPKIWIIGQFVPALIFASYLSVKFFGSLSFYKIYVENAVILVFALVTNISFFKRTWEDRKEEDVEESSLASHHSASWTSDSETYSSGRYRCPSLIAIYSSDDDSLDNVARRSSLPILLVAPHGLSFIESRPFRKAFLRTRPLAEIPLVACY